MTAPLWFKAPFKILRLFVREKLRDRVYTVSANQLSLHVPRQSLPRHLGGQQEVDHSTWLAQCYNQQQRVFQMTNREEDCAGDGDTDESLLVAIKNSLDILTNNVTVTAPGTATTTTTTTIPTTKSTDDSSAVSSSSDQSPAALLVHNNPIISLVTSIGELKEDRTDNNNGSEAVAIPTTIPEAEDAVAAVEKLNLQNNNNTNNLNNNTNNESWTENPPSSASSGFSDDDSLAGSGDGGDYKAIDQIVEMVRERGRGGLMAEYAEIKMRAPEGTFTQARLLPNMQKNRYTDVLCYDHSRVVLSSSSMGGGHEAITAQDGDFNGLLGDSVDGPGTMMPTTDYINANFVDGYKQKNAYISTQGPLPKTSADFWRMVWEQRCLVIVMTTRVNERGRIKCGQYWETQEGSALEFGPFRIFTSTVLANEDYTVATLELTNLKVRRLWCLFTAWIVNIFISCRLRSRGKFRIGSLRRGLIMGCLVQQWLC